MLHSHPVGDAGAHLSTLHPVLQGSTSLKEKQAHDFIERMWFYISSTFPVSLSSSVGIKRPEEIILWLFSLPPLLIERERERETGTLDEASVHQPPCQPGWPARIAGTHRSTDVFRSTQNPNPGLPWDSSVVQQHPIHLSHHRWAMFYYSKGWRIRAHSLRLVINSLVLGSQLRTEENFAKSFKAKYFL